MRCGPMLPVALALATFAPSAVHAQCGVRTWFQGPEVPALWGHAIALDSLRNRVISFGGSNNEEGLLRQTWSFDGTAWTRLTTLNAPPSSYLIQNLAYDSARDRMVKYAGAGDVFDQRETWEFDGTNWALRSVQGPPALEDFSLVFDAARQRTVLFGGHNNTDHLNETWLWDGSTWTRAFPANSPPARGGAHIAYDAARQRVVLYGGPSSTGMALNDLWEWDGTNWTQSTVPGGPPNAVAGGMVYDSIRGHIHLNGNSINGVEDWTYNGVQWARLTLPPSGECGTNPVNKSIVFMPHLDRIVATEPADDPLSAFSRSYVFGNIAAPVCSRHPADDAVRPGSAIFLGARFSCTPGTTYRWYHNATPLSNFTSGSSGITGADSTDLTIYGPTVSAARSGEYWCIASSPCGPASSGHATITVGCNPVETVFNCGPSEALFTLVTPLGPVEIPVSFVGTLRLLFNPNCGSPEPTLSVVGLDLHTQPAIVQVPLAFGGSLTLNNARVLLDATHGDPGIAAMPTERSPWSRRFDQQEVEPDFTGLLNYNLLGVSGNYNLATLPPTLLAWTGAVNRGGLQTISLPIDGSWEFTTGLGDPLTLTMSTTLQGVQAAPCAPDIGATGGVPGADGNLDNNDFIVYIDYFFNADPRADRGTVGGVPGSDGQFDNNDFIVFIDQFFTGC